MFAGGGDLFVFGDDGGAPLAGNGSGTGRAWAACTSYLGGLLGSDWSVIGLPLSSGSVHSRRTAHSVESRSQWGAHRVWWK